jgi:hypothetical protein
MRTLIPVVVLALVIALSYHEVKSQGATSFSGFDLVDKTGNIRKPDGYRDLYQILGTFTVLNAIPYESETRLQAFFENSPSLIFLKDRHPT